MSNVIKEAFDHIKANDALKNATYKYVIHKTNKRRFIFTKKLIISLTAVLIFIIGGIYTYFLPIYAISVDADNSIEFTVNYFGRVINVVNHSSDSSLEVINLRYKDALENILDIYENEDIVITVIDDDAKRKELVINNIKDCFLDNENVYCRGASYNGVEKAHSLGISYGKYKAYLELEKLGSDLTIEDVKNLSMKQIRLEINHLMKQESNETSSDHNGNGKQKGNSKRLDNKNGS